MSVTRGRPAMTDSTSANACPVSSGNSIWRRWRLDRLSWSSRPAVSLTRCRWLAVLNAAIASTPITTNANSGPGSPNSCDHTMPSMISASTQATKMRKQNHRLAIMGCSGWAVVASIGTGPRRTSYMRRRPVLRARMPLPAVENPSPGTQTPPIAGGVRVAATPVHRDGHRRCRAQRRSSALASRTARNGSSALQFGQLRELASCSPSV